MGNRVLVTGETGYVGSHACKALALAGYLPVTYDSLERGHRWAARCGPLEVGNLHDQGRLQEVIRSDELVAALHLAAYPCVGESVEQPAKYDWNNFADTLALLEALRAGKVR